MTRTFAAVAATAFAAAGVAPAFANEIAAQCEAYVAEHGGDSSGCPCLGEAAANDPALAAAISAIETPEDLDAADAATKEAIAACFPDADV
ncbi:hypothetical protein [Amphiplicatus metriothermophilus]|uniref:HdeA/HdeB family protein n=1 Tax=Amphiplicatus metriothermophilus TaxID=1519374 RepID=A0A239PJQ4_9PROT|nr:hypothetical protein [Amphiplicatus metriothermophilus]MBB5517628.1 hypothetical protein [Amphiplicatus metriothermophilus]SNT68038.1 hypothetical protein SAMN06297382_0534 [Amphiplicatus metriothermophilus]